MAATVYRQLQIRRDVEASIPTLNEGELFLATDTKQVWIGTSGGNVKAAGKFIPVAPSDWAGTPPNNLFDAVNRLASAVADLLGGQIP